MSFGRSIRDIVADQEQDGLTHDDIFELLKNRRRRFTLHALKSSEKRLSLSDLSTRVTAWEQGIDPEDVVHEDRRHVYSALRRTHLPKLDDAGVIAYDESNNVVEPTETLEDIDIYTEVLREKEIPWSLYYLGLAGISVSLLLAVFVDAPVFGVLDPINIGVFVVVAFGVSALIHYVVGERTRLGTHKKPPEVR